MPWRQTPMMKWAEVEAALEASEPAFDDWREATAWIRGRT